MAIERHVIEEGVRNLVQRIGRLNPTFDTKADLFTDLGLKSASTLDLLVSLEEEFDVQIDDEAFRTVRTAEQMVQLIESLKSS
jgi:acyl carrier protein